MANATMDRSNRNDKNVNKRSMKQRREETFEFHCMKTERKYVRQMNQADPISLQ